MKSIVTCRCNARPCTPSKEPYWTFAGIKFVLLPSRDHIVIHNQDGDKVFSAGTDNVGIMYDATTGQNTRVAQHDAPVKAIKWIDTHHSSILITGSWDKLVRVRNPSYAFFRPHLLTVLGSPFAVTYRYLGITRTVLLPRFRIPAHGCRHSRSTYPIF